MFVRAARFAHIHQILFNVETIEMSGHWNLTACAAHGEVYFGAYHVSCLADGACMPRDQLSAAERWLEKLLFAGRWFMAPIYVGLLLILAIITVKFVEELLLALPSVLSMQERDLVLLVLGLIDLALLG